MFSAILASAVSVMVAGTTGLAAGTLTLANPAPAPQAAAAAVRGPLQTASDTPRCASHTKAEVKDGRPMVVTLAPGAPFAIGSLTGRDWTIPGSTDPSWRLNFYSFRWALPYLQKAVDTGQSKSTETIVAQIMRFYREYPDTGSTRTPGWDEGNSLRRLEALNCVYELTRDKRIVSAMNAEAAVLFGPRYYGPPYRPVHNHGLMANERLIKAGLLAGRKDWVEGAGARVRSEVDKVFSAKGISHEQASAYQIVNAGMWGKAGDTLADMSPRGENDPTVRAIRANVTRAKDAFQWMTEPDGRIVQIGDSKSAAGAPPAERTGVGAFRDDEAGWLIGRWSATSPSTDYYTLRYGPPRFAHGHHDKGNVTWSTEGMRILVGSGLFGYDATNPFVRWQQSPASSNVAAPVGAVPNRNALGMTSSTIRGSRHTHRLQGAIYNGRNYTRTVDVNAVDDILTVTDGFSGRGAADQRWHLDPAWQLVSAPRATKVARFAHAETGRVLEVRTSVPITRVSKGGTNPVSGWHFPAQGKREAAWEIHVRWNAGTLRTTFDVR